MSIFDYLRRRKPEVSSAETAKQRLLEVCISHTGMDGNDPTELIQKIKVAVLKILNEHYQANIDIGNVCTNLKKENETSYIALQVNLPDEEEMEKSRK